jgi:hypothetical protein
MTWSMTKNILISNSSDITPLIYQWKEKAKLNGWTVMSSGTGSTFNASGDSITATTMTNTANSWFRIRMPSVNGLTREFVFQRTTSTKTFQINYSMSGSFTGGGANSIPSASDEAVVFLGDLVATGQALNCFVGFGNAAENYNSYMFALVQSTKVGYFYMFFDFMQSGSSPTGDTDPLVIWSNTFSVPTQLGTGFIPATVQAPQYGGGYLNTSFAVMSLYTPSSHNSALPQYGANATGSGIDVFSPILGKHSGSIPRGTKGISTICKFSSVVLNTGDTLTLNTNKDRIAIDQMILPWDGTDPIL